MRRAVCAVKQPRMNRAQKRAALKILADKMGGKKKLAAMLEEAKARARAEDAAKLVEQAAAVTAQADAVLRAAAGDVPKDARSETHGFDAEGGA